jgi:hypothetical protein
MFDNSKTSGLLQKGLLIYYLYYSYFLGLKSSFEKCEVEDDFCGKHVEIVSNN